MCLLLPPVCVLETKLCAVSGWRGKVRNVIKVFTPIVFLVSSLEEVWLLQSCSHPDVSFILPSTVPSVPSAFPKPLIYNTLIY
jgi:hypothetical protein